MRLSSIVATLLAAGLISASANANTISLISSDAANIGNGQFRSDDAGVSTSLPVLLNEAGSVSTNVNGRALIQFGNDGENNGTGSPADLSTITDNAGLDIDGFTIFRGEYAGGNNSFGLLENGTRLGQSNEADNGNAFANSGGLFVLSDVITQDIAAGDTLNISFDIGSDNGTVPFEAFVYFDGANVGSSLGPVANASGSSFVRADFDVTGETASSFQILVAAGTGRDVRPLIDNFDVSLDQAAIPEPGSALLALMGLTFAGAAGMRRRLG